MARKTPHFSPLRLIGAVALCQLSGIIGSVFTVSAITEWYAFLNKPFFSPPNWVFGPVWTTLYTLMGISLYLVWQQRKGVSIWFWIQLVLNTLWSISFFALKSPTLAFINVIVLWLSIFLTIKQFYRVQKVAGLLLIPYLLWVTFATLLNAAIAVLN